MLHDVTFTSRLCDCVIRHAHFSHGTRSLTAVTKSTQKWGVGTAAYICCVQSLGSRQHMNTEDVCIAAAAAYLKIQVLISKRKLLLQIREQH